MNPLVPQSPEYAIPYGVLMVIFKAVVAKREKQTEVLDYFDQFSQSLPSFQSYGELFPNSEMKILLATIYADMLALLEKAASYYTLGRLGKLVDAVFPRSKYEFSKEFSKLTFLTKRLHDLAEQSHYAEQQSVKQTVEGNRSIIAGMYRIMNAAVGNMTDLSREVDEIREFSSKWNNVQAVQASSSLQNALLHNVESFGDEMRLWETVRFRLSQRDRWEGNGILLYLSFWTRLPSNSILWISGPSSSRDTWVSQFSLDLIRASQAQESLLTFALCDRPRGRSYTDVELVKRLICRIIERRPILVFESPEIFDARLFQRAETFEKVWELFSRIVATLDMLFLIIDRLDLCHMESQSDEGESLLTRLSDLVEQHQKRLKVVVTSGEPGPPPSKLAISFCKIETQTRPFRRPNQLNTKRQQSLPSSLSSYSVTTVSSDRIVVRTSPPPSDSPGAGTYNSYSSEETSISVELRSTRSSSSSSVSHGSEVRIVRRRRY